MQYHWLNKQNNEKLIIFFTGWSFDENPFKFLKSDNFDVMIFYDYNNLEIPVIPQYKEYFLISWSMGVYTAYLLKDKLPKFSRKIAVNGTPFPVNDEFGIPLKPFLLTLKHAQKGLEGKFYRNIFDSPNEYERYQKAQVQRSIESRVSELNSLYEQIKNTNLCYEKYYDRVIISRNDSIIPAKNQINFWRGNADIKLLECGHFPYYNFKSWNEILCM